MFIEIISVFGYGRRLYASSLVVMKGRTSVNGNLENRKVATPRLQHGFLFTGLFVIFCLLK